MPDRLSPLDVSFLYLEEAAAPMHVGTVAVFAAPASGFDHDRFVALIRERIAFVPRYRQRVRWVPGRLANPVWVDDEHFDLDYHVRRSALPRPGDDEQLRELVARLQGRRLDRSRPLWETYLVEGLAGDRFAIVTKSHHAMVDGVTAVDIGQVVLDPSPHARPGPPPAWRPAPEPSWAELLAGAVSDVVSRPGAVVDTLRGGLADVRRTAERVAGDVAAVARTAASAARPAPPSPLNAAAGQHRRFATVTTELDDYKRVRKAHGATVNDVALATLAGGLRQWLMTRGEAVTRGTVVRTLVPVSVHPEADDVAGAAAGTRVSSVLVDLPVGEPNPVVRLHQVSYAMRAHAETGRAVGAQALAGLAGFAPPTLHALGARVAAGLSRRLVNTVVTNVPGPQTPLYAAGARMLETYPVIPLARGTALAVGLTSYDGRVFYGLNGDRDAMADIDVVAQCVRDALAELVDSVP